ncbi:hypothetical protein [Clostridium sp. JNZ J1-5]
MDRKKKYKIAIIICFYLVEFTLFILSILNNKYDYINELISAVVVFSIYVFFEFKYHLNISNYLVAFISLTIISHNFFGNYMSLYTTSTVFDKVLHVFGTYAFSLFFYEIILKILKQPANLKFYNVAIVILLGISIGTFFEIAEFFGDIMFHPEKPYQPGLVDTDIDLIANTLGAFAAGLHLYFNR